ncbi:hypothetical protein [Kineococcus terrestris]|uniref:hypothetical protein n=1 Tax=Kineococcus terrestris TaxID=2044856 RepID=UPI0034DB2D2B
MAAVVTAGAAVAVLEDGTPAYFYRGALLHDGVPAAEVQRLADLGLVAVDGEAFVPVLPEPVAGPAPQTASAARPRRVASKDEWVAYAVALGADRATVEALSKDEILAEYGG